MKKDKVLILTIGAPGSGKSTWAKEQSKNQGVANVNRDSLRLMVKSLDKPNEWRYGKENEKKVTDLMLPIIDTFFETHHTVIVSDTNLNPSTRQMFIDYSISKGVKIEYKTFDMSWKKLLERNTFRGDKAVPVAVLRSMYQSMTRYMGRVAIHNEALPKAIIFDIDGTVASMKGRSPFDWSRVGEDLPIKHVVDMIVMYKNMGYTILSTSGRDEVCRPETELWLDENGIYPKELFMRSEGDQTEDSYVKYDLYKNHIEPFYNVEFVLDDRSTVVEMWRAIGLNCLQVNDGDF